MSVTWAGAAWLGTTGYVVADRVVNGGNVYRCVTAGTSAGSGGPTGTDLANPVTDGSVSWLYLGPSGGAVTDVAPEVSTAAVATQRAILDVVDRQVPVATWEAHVDDGARYLAAHLATLSRSRGKGPSTSEGVGPLNRAYADMTSFGSLGQTSYGTEYLRLTRLLDTAFGMVV